MELARVKASSQSTWSFVTMRNASPVISSHSEPPLRPSTSHAYIDDSPRLSRVSVRIRHTAHPRFRRRSHAVTSPGARLFSSSYRHIWHCRPQSPEPTPEPTQCTSACESGITTPTRQPRAINLTPPRSTATCHCNALSNLAPLSSPLASQRAHNVVHRDLLSNRPLPPCLPPRPPRSAITTLTTRAAACGAWRACVWLPLLHDTALVHEPAACTCACRGRQAGSLTVVDICSTNGSPNTCAVRRTRPRASTCWYPSRTARLQPRMQAWGNNHGALTDWD